MNIKFLYIFIIIIAISCLTNNLNSQILNEDIREIRILENLDTVKINRTLGDWWFGPYFSVTPLSSIYFGKLNINENKFPGYEQYDKLIQFSGGSGWGYSVGLFGEWKKVSNDWGINLKASFIDYRKSNTQTKLNDTLQTSYENQSNFQYLSLMPSYRLDIKYLEGLHAFGGLDFDIPISATADLIKRFRNPERIEETYKIKYNEQNFRVGINLGIAYDFFAASISSLARSRFSFFASMHTGTVILSDYKSTFNNLSFKFGFVIKIGPDVQSYDTTRFDPIRNEMPEYLATVDVENGVFFGGFRPQTFAGADLVYFEVPQIINVVPDTVEIARTEVNIQPFKPKETPKKITIVPNQTVSFEFGKNANSTNLTVEMKEYLDLIAEFLKQNPRFRVIVEGHTDDRGTRDIQNKISTERAAAAKQELRNKGIPEGRIIARGRGSLVPKVPNTTEANRAKNRRLEIIIERGN
jgi:outer membrane protein OmpA-like peptidoglycan-associated protein